MNLDVGLDFIKPLIVRRVIIVGLVLLFGYACESNQEQPLTQKEINRFLTKRYFEISDTPTEVQDFKYELLSGVTERFSENKGSIVLLNFWASWCFPCKKEMPDLEQLNHKLKNDSFRLIAVNSGDEREKIKRFLERNPYSFDIMLDEKMNISKQFGVTGLPTTFILTSDLKIIGKVMGPIDWKDRELVRFLKRLHNYSVL